MQNYFFRFFTDLDDHIFRIKRAEDIEKVWKVSLLLFLSTIIMYIWMAWLGMGTNPISSVFMSVSESTYNALKLYFIAGRAIFAVLLAALVLYLTSYYFYLFTKIRYKKLVVMQQIVLSMMLVERLLWIPLFVYLGLDWYVSPFSLGVLASYLIDLEWFIYFFGAVSIIQLWIIGFQAKYLSNLTDMKRWKIWLLVILWHFFVYCIVATLSLFDIELIEWWLSS